MNTIEMLRLFYLYVMQPTMEFIMLMSVIRRYKMNCTYVKHFIVCKASKMKTIFFLFFRFKKEKLLEQYNRGNELNEICFFLYRY